MVAGFTEDSECWNVTKVNDFNADTKETRAGRIDVVVQELHSLEF